MPYAIPAFVSVLVWKGLLNPDFGVINSWLGPLYELLDIEPIMWLKTKESARAAVLLVNTWLGFPYMFLITTGALQSIPKELIEAAKVDGASSWQIFIKITVPMLYPFIGLALLFRSIDAFKTFDIIYVLTSGGPGILTRTLNLYAFKHGIEFLSMGYAGSIAIVMLIITIVVAQIFLRKNKLLTPKDTFK